MSTRENESLDRAKVFGRQRVADIVLQRVNGRATANIPHTHVVHSPDGFEWSYPGSGPADLALNILALFVPYPTAYVLHQDYKWDVLVPLNARGPHTITAESVREWIAVRTKQDVR